METAGSMGDNERRRLVLTLLTRLQCAECEQTYHAHDFTVMHRESDVWMLEAHCRNCGDTAHVVVAIQVDHQAEPVSELTPEEVVSFGDFPPISVDDVLDMHLLLQTLDIEPFDFDD
jgi:hypothetical protein